MIGRLLLMVIQFVACWYVQGDVEKYLAYLHYVSSSDRLSLILFTAVIALFVWLIGAVAAVALKDVPRPSMPTLLVVFGTALVLAILTTVPDVMLPLKGLIGEVDATYFPIVGAILAYAVQR